MTASDEKKDSLGSWIARITSLKELPLLLGVLCYVTGFAITTVYLGTLGITNFEVLRVKYVVTGAMFLFFLSLLTLPLAGYWHLITHKYAGRQAAAVPFYSGAIVFCLLFVTYVFNFVSIYPSLHNEPEKSPTDWLVAVLSLGLIPALTYLCLVGVLPITLAYNAAFVALGSALVDRWQHRNVNKVDEATTDAVSVQGKVDDAATDAVSVQGKSSVSYAFDATIKMVKEIMGDIIHHLPNALVLVFLGALLFGLINLLASLLTGKLIAIELWNLGWAGMLLVVVVIYLAVGGILSVVNLTRDYFLTWLREIPLPTLALLRTLLIFSLLATAVCLYALGIYPTIPQHLGGGSPQRVNISVSKENERLKDLLMQGNAYLVDRTSEGVFLYIVPQATLTSTLNPEEISTTFVPTSTVMVNGTAISATTTPTANAIHVTSTIPSAVITAALTSTAATGTTSTTSSPTVTPIPTWYVLEIRNSQIDSIQYP